MTSSERIDVGEARTPSGPIDVSEATGRIIFALDYPDLERAHSGAAAVAGGVGVLKVGLELFVKEGPAALRVGEQHGLPVFADLKLHDIPETVDRSIAAVGQSGARFVTVHAQGGARMLERAVSRAARERTDLQVLAVTLLTSLDESDLRAQGIEHSVDQHVARLAALAWGAGVRGFVCSPSEVRVLRQTLGAEAVLVTPGVRMPGGDAQDQKRIATPRQAIEDGASYLVVGRPIRDAHDPRRAASAIAREIADGLAASQGPG